MLLSQKKYSYVVVVGVSPELIDEVRVRGYKCIHLVEPRDVRLLDLHAEDIAVSVDYINDETYIELINLVAKSKNIVAVVAFSEAALLPCAKISNLLNLRGPSLENVLNTRNKYLSRKILKDKIKQEIEFHLCHNLDDVINAINTVGFPVIVKPVNGVSSENVYLINEESDIGNFRFNKSVYFGECEYIVEKFIEGREFCIDCIVDKGKINILGINEELKIKNHSGNIFVEGQHIFPARIDEKSENLIKESIKAFHEALGIYDGPTHTEIILGDNNTVYFIETHTRFAGDHIPELYRRSTSINPISLYLDWALGEELTFPEFSYRGVCIKFFNPKPGVVKSITGLETAKSDHRVTRIVLNITTGSIVPNVMMSADRVGYIIVVCDSSEEAAYCADKIMSGINIETSE